MRIISGSHKGRQIIAPSNLNVRPTTDFAKSALFNILNSYFNIEELSVLDLFAGTGNISYEFASRGCKSIVSVDISERCSDFIRSTASKLEFGNINVIRSNAFTFLEKNKAKFNLIFADPPYDMPDLEKIAEIVFSSRKSEILNPGAWLVIEHSTATNFSKHPNFYQHRIYGKVNFSILINNI